MTAAGQQLRERGYHQALGVCPLCGEQHTINEAISLNGGENPAYGPGNPDWEHDRERDREQS